MIEKTNKFEELNINEGIISALNELEILSPTPIQEQSIPYLLEGYDCIGQAQTGTGKTFAYSIPLIERIDEKQKCVQALVLCPTRELSLQVSKEIDKLASKINKFKIATIYGGESYEKQFRELKQKPQVIIGTPGRIIDQMNRGNIDFSSISYLVLDEADEMLKMGFQDDLETILKTMPKERQTALFSATLPQFIKNVAKNYMIDPKMVKIENKTLTAVNIDQQIYYCKNDQKKDLLVRLIDFYDFKSVMIFSNTKAMVDELVLFLQQSGYSADGLHGDLKQSVRDRVMQGFRTSSVRILIATDVAARGIDVEGIEAIVNYDLPNENEVYVHRIGRTARAGASGVAISLVSPRQHSKVYEIEKYINQKIRRCEVPSISDINAHKQKKLFNKIVDDMKNLDDDKKYDNMILKLSQENEDPLPLLKALLKMVDKDQNRVYANIDIVNTSSGSRNKDQRSGSGYKDRKSGYANKSGDRSYNMNDKTLIEINLGQNDQVKPNQLVSFFHDELNIHRENVGKITIKNTSTYIEVNKNTLKYFKNLNNKRLNGRRVNYKEVKKIPN